MKIFMKESSQIGKIIFLKVKHGVNLYKMVFIMILQVLI